MAILEENIKDILTLENYTGEWRDSRGDHKDVINPATNKVIAKVPYSTKDEVNEAIKTAQGVYPEWRETPPMIRVRCLFRLKELLEENFEELSIIQTMEHGKTIDESRGETRRGIENVEVATGITSLMMGHNLEDVSGGIDVFNIRQSLGVFACIAPYNFPFMVPLWFAPYAAATGNCIIVKPSPRAPISQAKIAELVDEAGFPPGVWNVLHGDKDVADELMEHPDIKGVCFVGSTPVAKSLYEKAGKTGKRIIAQGGAKNFVVIMPDADLSKTIPALMTSFYGNAGQRCLAAANAVVLGDDAFYKRFTSLFKEAASKIRVGNGLDESIQMGPLQTEKSKLNVLQFIESGVKEGAKLILDGRDLKIEGGHPENCFLNPTIFEDVTLKMKIAKEEIFGPVACIMRGSDLDEAIEMIHSNPYGNSAAIFTSSGKAAREFRYKVNCGNIGINVGIPAPVALFAFGGMKDSFFGVLHAQGQDVIRFFTENKQVIERWL